MNGPRVGLRVSMLASILVAGCASSPPAATSAPASAVSASPAVPTNAEAAPNASSTPAPAIPPAPTTRDGMRVMPLNAVAVQFASYLNSVHRRIHPEFTDKELARFAALPPNDPLNDPTLTMRVELVIGGADGRLVKTTIAKPSATPAFDEAAIDSLKRADGFGVPPREIVSEDGNVHVDWQFSRDEKWACSTMLVRPLLLGR